MSMGEFEFGDNGDNAKTIPVSMLARTGQPINHFFWGRIVHDLSGMFLHKNRIPIDYAHDPDQVIGFLNKFDTKSGDLKTSGALVPFSADDKASEVIHKAKNGVPYEASINFAGDGLKLEELDAGEETEVNGFTFHGPGIVVREWPLRGVAIVPYGADMQTATEFSGDPEISVEVLNSKGGSTMSKPNKKKTSKPGDAPNPKALSEEGTPGDSTQDPAGDAGGDAPESKPGDATPNPDDAAGDAAGDSGSSDPPAEREGDPRGNEYNESQDPPPADGRRAEMGARFVDAFGERGAEYFAAGMSFEQAQTKFTEAISQDNAQLTTENETLRQRLSAAERGGDAVDFSAESNEDPDGKPVKSLSAMWEESRQKGAA